jgi:hypothetical protein
MKCSVLLEGVEMSKTQSLVKKAAVFEKLAKYGSRKDFLHSLADSVSDQQAAFQKAKELFNKALSNAKKYSNDTNPEVRSAFSALPVTSPKDAVELSAAADKFSLFSQKLYEQGKKENNNQKMIAANTIGYAARDINSQVDVMKGAWPEPPAMEDEPEDSDFAPGGRAEGYEPAAINFPAQEVTLSRLQSVKNKINLMNNLANGLQSKPAPAKSQALKQINNLVVSLQASLKNNNWGAIKDYIIGRKLITDSLQSLYNDKLEYDDLALVPALDYGKGVPEAAY